MCDVVALTQYCKMMFHAFYSKDNDENSCGCREKLQAIQRDVAEMKAVVTSEKATSELKNKFKCTIDQELVGALLYISTKRRFVFSRPCSHCPQHGRSGPTRTPRKN